MCCGNEASAEAGTHTSQSVSETLVAGPLPDGYWVQAFPFSTTTNSDRPDIIAYGLGFKDAPSTVRLFTNPLNDSRPSGWKVSEIASLDFPVGMTFADLTGDGFNDVIICDRYGPSMDDLWSADTQNGGRVQWLRNPGKRAGQPFWQANKIGNSTGMHRLQAGHFTTTDVVQVMGLPIISQTLKQDPAHQVPAPVIIFTPHYGEDRSKGPSSWNHSVAFPSQFRMIHDVKLLPRSNGNLDMVVVSGQEGIVLLWFDLATSRWQFNVIGEGIPKPSGYPEFHEFFGCGSVDICRVGNDDVGYIATVEAFHGHIVAVYVKSPGAPKGPSSLKNRKYWTRHIIDDFGPLDKKTLTGPLHHVAKITAADSDSEAFAVACMGVPSGDRSRQGVYLYRPVDLVKSTFEKVKVTGESAGRLAVAGYSTAGRMDIASLSYYVPGYFTGPDPPQLRIDVLGNKNDLSQIYATKLDQEVLLRVPRPSAIQPGAVAKLPFWTLASRTLVVFVLSKNDRTVLDSSIAAVKVIYGELTVTNADGSKSTHSLAPAPKTAKSTLIQPGTSVAAGVIGAVFIGIVPDKNALTPITSMKNVQSASAMPHTDTIPQDVASSTFPFARVDSLPWAKEGPDAGKWDDFEFYNALGFHVYFNDDSVEKIVHIQAWTLGLGETARFHVHNQTGRSFCEIHYCLTNGGGSAGMRYFPDSFSGKPDPKEELTKDYVEQHSALVKVPDYSEHGPLWIVQPHTTTTPQLLPNGAVDYPWHAWLASQFGDYKLPILPPLDTDKQKFDVWLAFEFPSSAFQY
ncbi:unnamed protein product [Peniophora sp. CBMAI 1063]|nr:unnamed protein product [Peniophora sp. CBMAI 1063]